MQQDSALLLKNVTKTYGRSRGITDISLTVNVGEIFGFLGPNGAGKSTTIKTILNLIKPDTGSITVLGMDARSDYVKTHANIGYLAGDMETDQELTGRQYLLYAASIRHMRDLTRMEEYTKRLQAELHKKIKHLSRGNKQKIGLIAALMHDPDLLILDEPTSGLDPLMQSEFNKILREHAQRGKTAFISSHILSEVQNICDRVGFIREGKLINIQLLSELLSQTTKRVRITFRDVPPINEIQNLKGASNVHTLNRSVTFHYIGDPNILTSFAAKHTVSDIAITETDLEELFMHYYQNTDGDKDHV